jgi:hypothetical protein
VLYGMNTKTVWFQNVLVCLLDANLREYDNLIAGLDKSTMLVAWACRNMLELNIFTKYTLAKGSYARDFTDDMFIDAVDIFSSFREWLLFHNPAARLTELDGTLAALKGGKAGQNIVRASYLRVSKIAEIVKFSDEYRTMSKATSKLVHPTAFSVLGKPDEDKELRRNFFLAAIRYGLDAFHEVQDHVEKHGVEPLP